MLKSLILLYLTIQNVIAQITSNYTLDNLTQLKLIPFADLKQTILFNDSTATLKTQAYGKYFYRLDSNRVINVWDTSNSNSYTLVCTVSSPNTIQDFNIDIYSGDFAYVDGNKNIKVVYPNCTVNGTFTVPYTTVNSNIFLSFTYVHILFSKRNNSDSNRNNNLMFKYFRSNFTLKNTKDFSQQFSNGNATLQLRYAHCVKPKNWGVAQYFFMYTQNSYYIVYGQDNSPDGPWKYARESSQPPNAYSWTIKSVKFDIDCGFIYLAHGPPLNKLTILYHDKAKFINEVNLTNDVYNAVPFDQKKWMVAVFFANKSAVFYDVSNTTMANSHQGDINVTKDIKYLFKKDFNNLTNQNTFSRSVSKFYTANDNSVQVYTLQCPSGIRLGMGLCLDTFDEAIQKNQISQQLKYLFSAIKAMALIISFMQVTPFAGVFLRFINFWTICSIYSLVQIQTKEPLTSILYQIFVLINASLFNLLGIKFDVSISKQQKVTGKYINQYQITSNFAPTVIQPIVCTFIMCILLYVFEWIKHVYFSEDNKRKYGINKLKIFFGQYVSFMSVFMFPLRFIFGQLNQGKYTQKYNQVFHIIFICISMMIPFILIFVDVKKQKKFNRHGKTLYTIGLFTSKSIKKQQGQSIIQKQQSILSFEYIQFIYISLVNIIMPILGTINNPYWFTFICGGLILCGILVDIRRDQWRINSIIMSVQLFVFHVCFCLNLIDMKQNNKYIVSIATMVMLMVGALHEILTLFFRIIYDAFNLFCRKSKVGDQLKKKQQNKQINMKSKVQKIKSIKRQQQQKKQQDNLRQSNNKKSIIKLKMTKSNQNNLKDLNQKTDKKASNEGNRNNQLKKTVNKVKIQQIDINSPLYFQQQIIPNRKQIRFISMKSKTLKRDEVTNAKIQTINNEVIMRRKQKQPQKQYKEQDHQLQNKDQIRESPFMRQGTIKKSTYKNKIKLKPKTNSIY